MNNAPVVQFVRQMPRSYGERGYHEYETSDGRIHRASELVLVERPDPAA